MFTGIIEAIGTVRQLTRHSTGTRVEIAAAPIAQATRPGDSLAVEGACLTVTAVTGTAMACDLSAETLACTTLGALRVGTRVNLERPLRLGDRVGGHLVSGHVDGVGRLVGRTPQGEGAVYRIRFPEALASCLVSKGSVAVDGISLTVAALAGLHFEVAVVPYTLQGTTLAEKRVGAQLNLETDLIGKYVARLAAGRGMAPDESEVTLAVLKEYGFA